MQLANGMTGQGVVIENKTVPILMQNTSAAIVTSQSQVSQCNLNVINVKVLLSNSTFLIFAVIAV